MFREKSLKVSMSSLNDYDICCLKYNCVVLQCIAVMRNALSS